MDEFEHPTLTAPDLYDESLEALIVPVSKEIRYEAKSTLSRPGERMDFIYYIKKGSTKHYMDSEDGMLKMLYTLTPGWFFGETPYFMKIPTGLHSYVTDNTILYKIPGAHCDAMIKESDLFRDKIIKCFSHKMLILRYEVASLSFNSCKERLRRLFCTSADRDLSANTDWYNLKIRYTHQELGEIVGGSRVTISRQINELCKEGFIRMLNRNIQVHQEKCSAYLRQKAMETGYGN